MALYTERQERNFYKNARNWKVFILFSFVPLRSCFFFFSAKSLSGCATGGCKVSLGYNLPAKYVLHTVGPIGERPKKLRECYTNCLEAAVAYNMKTVAFCGVSTGIYGYPLYR